MPQPAEKVLADLVAATTEAKATIRDLHAARATALDVDKKHRERVTQTIVTEIERQIGELSADARQQMHTTITTIMNRIETDWRAKLGLDDGT